ncbi:MAG TPA: hypothetical protein VGF30_00275 [Bacteroidia bacterium]
MKLKITIFITNLLSYILVPFALLRRKKDSVLHISYMVHIAYFTVKILRENGVKADYLAIGHPGKWQADYIFAPSYGHLSAKERIREFMFFWKVVARYRVIHSHFMMTLTPSAWEMKFFRMLGGKWVVHGRGCAERVKEVNIKLHPKMNICQQCDYNARICTDPVNVMRRKMTAEYADHVLVTTPDMLDFIPTAEHMPFFFPPVDVQENNNSGKKTGPFKIVHVTNHPGIEGTEHIRKAVDNLKGKGYDIDFMFLTNMDNSEVLEVYKTADLSIGKMKMGYYANAQIESLYVGVPAITYVREEFVTPEIERSGLILAHLDNLEEVIRFYIDNPDKLKEKRDIAKRSVIELHNNTRIAQRYKEIYLNLLN